MALTRMTVDTTSTATHDIIIGSLPNELFIICEPELNLRLARAMSRWDERLLGQCLWVKNRCRVRGMVFEMTVSVFAVDIMRVGMYFLKHWQVEWRRRRK